MPAVFLVQSFLGNLALATSLTLASLYAIQDAHLGAFELLVVGAAVEGSVLLSEIPTGIAADVWGRKRAIVLGTALTGVSFLVWGAAPAFAMIVLAQVAWGLGDSLRSGAVQAWLTDEVGEEAANRLFLRGSQTALLGAVLGTLLAGALAVVGLGVPLLVGGGIQLIVAAFLFVTMHDSGVAPARVARRDGLRVGVATLAEGVSLVRTRPVIGTILAIAVFHGAASEAIDRLWELRLLGAFSFPALGPLVGLPAWFSAINLITMLVAVGVAEVLRRRLDTSSHHSVSDALLTMQLVLVVTVALFGLVPALAGALGALFLYRIVRDIVAPLSDAWLNQNLEPSTRATVFSFAGQADAVGQIGGGPLLGLLAAVLGAGSAIAMSAGLLVPGVLLYLRARSQPGNQSSDGGRVEAVANVQE
jgi:DHA3 family tetracycline resistance protein-like MFS transporter